MMQPPDKLPFRTRLKIHYLLMVSGAVVTMAGCHISANLQLHPVAWLGILVMATGLVWRILYIKCPHCGDGLYQSRSISRYCPNCGKPLDDR